jgi:anti-sigma-K factor RskA
LAAAAAVIVVLALGAALATRGGKGGIEGQAEEAADAKGSTVVKLTTGDRQDAARVVMAKGADYVIFDDLNTLPADKTYQLWRLDEGVPSSLGVLGTGSKGATKLTLPGSTSSFAISVEPAGGSNTPTRIVAT